MKKINIAYWIVTGLFGLMMLFSAIPQKESYDMIVGQMHYPDYVVPFLSVVKTLGVIAILIPGFPRVKEWAYAGLMFDLSLATYSFIAMGLPPADYAGMLIFFIPGIASYILYHKKVGPVTI